MNFFIIHADLQNELFVMTMYVFVYTSMYLRTKLSCFLICFLKVSSVYINRMLHPTKARIETFSFYHNVTLNIKENGNDRHFPDKTFFSSSELQCLLEKYLFELSPFYCSNLRNYHIILLLNISIKILVYKGDLNT